MRRLLVSVAFLAALLIAPSAALALDPPANAAAPAATNVAPVVTWTDVLLGLSYNVFRADAACATNPTFPTTPVGTVPPGIGSFTDNTVTLQGSYCYFVQTDDGIITADSGQLPVIFDTTSPAITLTPTGGSGCVPYTVSATATDNLTSTTMTADAVAYLPGTTLAPAGAPFASVNTTFIATDAAGNPPTTAVATGAVLDPDRPPAPTLEITTDPAQLKATLSWDSVTAVGAPVTGYRVRVKGPGTPEANVAADVGSIVFPNLQVDATYEYSLTAKDACGDSAASVRLVRLNDTTPPTVPIVAQPAYIAASKAVALSWVPSSDNVQIDHYVILRNGVPLSATDATTFTDTDTARLQATSPSYVVRAVDTNGNIMNSDAKTVKVPDWSPPTQPVMSAPKVNGTTVTLTWSGAADNIGVVGYDVLRNGKAVASMTGAVRKYIDRNVKPGAYTYVVLARDDQGLATGSIGQNVVVRKQHVKATVVALKMAGALRGGATRYAIKGPARLLLDVRIVGDLKKARLRVYVQSGKGRITVWRGTPGSSAPRERLHSALARHGWVTIKLNRTLHPGRTRLVLIASNRMVIAGKGPHKPSMPDK